jgi:hypothetical protein
MLTVTKQLREFQSFPDINRIGKVWITVTQKIHGTNAAIWIERDASREGFSVRAAKRSSFIYPEHDNYGFAAFVHANRAELIEKLGEGIWHGEWAGPGINSGEGLTEKTFCLFSVKGLEGKALPTRCKLVPLLYEGPLDTSKIEAAKADLKANGSKLVAGYMHPEGVVVHFLGTNFRIKDVFAAEETAWTKGSGGPKTPTPTTEYIAHLLQPIRLEKLMSRDESYRRAWPTNFGCIMSDYVKDLEKEGQLDPDPDRAKAQKKALGRDLALFLKAQLGVGPLVAPTIESEVSAA